jgi:hypothetical protein
MDLGPSLLPAALCPAFGQPIGSVAGDFAILAGYAALRQNRGEPADPLTSRRRLPSAD